MAILRLRDANGNVTDVPAIVGPQGPQGPAGSDATVTADRIKNALGYTPANQEDVSNLSDQKADYTYVDNKIASLEQANYVFVDSESEMTDKDTVYVYKGYIYKWGTYEEEVVIPGETIVVDGKAVIIKGYRYSHSGQSFTAHASTASVIFPIEVTEVTTSSNPVRLLLTNMKRSTSYTGLYNGSTNTAFTGDSAQSVTNSTSATDYSIYGLPIGKWFAIFFVQYDGTQTFENASFSYDGVTFSVGDNMEVYDDPSYASEAVMGSTTTTPGTTETVTKEGFYNTGNYIKPSTSSPSEKKSKSISIDNTVQALTSSVSMTIPQLKKNKTIAFSGVYTGTLSEISIIQGEGTGWTEVKCVVNEKSITISKDGSSVYTAEHGLTFGSYFSIALVTKNANKTKAYLSSGGATFTSGEFIWNASRNSLTVYTNVPFTQYRLSFGSNDFDKKLWLYGDSYFDHWLPLSIARGYTNCLADGYSGGGSSSGASSFELAMKHGTPSKVVWCLGMNNGDNGSVNSSWLSAITSVKEICDANGIELWVTTIPNTPSVNNLYKNAYIRTNFENVIDIAKFVGADESTSWHTGLLSSDNVHPTTEGDFYIANIMEGYFPEMLEA